MSLFGAVILPIEALEDARLSVPRLFRVSKKKDYGRKRSGKRHDENDDRPCSNTRIDSCLGAVGIIERTRGTTTASSTWSWALATGTARRVMRQWAAPLYYRTTRIRKGNK